MNPQVTVIDYGMGNLLSVCRALEHVGASVKLCNTPEEILQAQRLILPGVGAFSNAMNELKQRELIIPIHECVKNGIPILGICLGSQLLLDFSEEYGQHEGLGLIPGNVCRIPEADKYGRPLKIPHVGWSDLIVEQCHPLLNGVTTDHAVYFVHSYQCIPMDNHNRICHCEYGGHELTAMISHQNIMGCQFHPEKSGPLGLRILSNFLQISGDIKITGADIASNPVVTDNAVQQNSLLNADV